MRLLLVAVMMAGCIEPHYTACGNVVCVSTTQVCSVDQQCVSPDQIDACTNVADGARCTFATTEGFCHHGACVTSLGTCGDGVAQLALDEVCDCGTPDVLLSPPAGCNGFNSSAPTASCRLDCRPATCGDGIVDANELCDDGNTTSGDGCRADCQGRFVKMQTPTANPLHQVAVLGPTNAYVVGLGGVIHYDGIAWSNVDLGVAAGDVLAIQAIAPNDIYIAGSTVAGQPLLLHFDGTTWTALATGASNTLTGVFASAPNDIYVATSNAELRHYTGTWNVVATPCSNQPSSSIVVGTNASNVYFGAFGLCRFDGAMWSKIDNGNVSALVASSTDVLETTQNQFLYRWSGATSSIVAMIPGFVSAVAATSPDEILVAGSGTILQLSGGTWTNLVTPTERQLNYIAATAPTNVFIVGNEGTVLH
jgi:cysteine-rich repeat protein